MSIVTKNKLESWANTVSSKSTLPHLVSRLIRATTPSSTKLNMSWGNSIYIGGWDSIVSCKEERAYVPLGISSWELGTDVNCKEKADNDYEKRTNNPLGVDPQNATFVFVTPRLWTKKTEWIAAKKAEGYWKDVIAYDAVDLEQWLDSAPAVDRWLSSEKGIEACPFEGVMTTDEFWNEWSTSLSIILTPECVTAGRELEINQLRSMLQDKPTIKGIRAPSSNEALAFIVAAMRSQQDETTDRFHAQTLIIDSEANFRAITINSNHPLVIIPRFYNAQPLYAAVSKGHHVLVPLGANDSFNLETIELPSLKHHPLVNALEACNIPWEKAMRLLKEAAYNITRLKRLLGFPDLVPKWSKREDIREIIPALLLGKWNENFGGDVLLVEKLSQKKYSNYLTVLNKWKSLDEPPITQIEESWQINAPFELWNNLVAILTKEDIECLQSSLFLAYQHESTEQEDSLSSASLSNHAFSKEARKGLAQSLVLLAIQQNNKPNIDNPQTLVNKLVRELLWEASPQAWISMEDELPLLAEAAPEEFLEAVKHSLEQQHPEILDMFCEGDDYIGQTSNHVGLLWALEQLAWLPEYILEASLILLKLTRLEPGGHSLNRPINSLQEIFKPCHYQTLTTFKDRMTVLSKIAKKEKESGWTLLTALLPPNNNIAHSTYKMKWRTFETNTSLTYSGLEVSNTYAAILDLLFELFDDNEEKFAQMLQKVPELPAAQRKKLIDWAYQVYPNVKHEKALAWETIRGILHRHRSCPDTDWALSEDELAPLEDLYNRLRPQNVIRQYLWLFNEQWPKIPEGIQYKSNEYEEAEKIFASKRSDALTSILTQVDLDKVMALRTQIEAPETLGRTLATIINDQEEVLHICQCLNDSPESSHFIRAFIAEKLNTHGFDWLKALFEELHEKRFSPQALSNLLLAFSPPKQQLWDFIDSLEPEIQKQYWLYVVPYFKHLSNEERVLGNEMLMKVGRYSAVIRNIWLYLAIMPSKLLVDVLWKINDQEDNRDVFPREHHIICIFEELSKRTDVDRETLKKLEIKYLSSINDDSGRGSKILQEELVQQPKFFVEVLTWLYSPQDETLQENERAGLSTRELCNRIQHAHHLLQSWNKIPGMSEDNSINGETLRNWIQQARTLAETASRLDVADEEIGQLLARYPEKSPLWPAVEVFRIIDDINSESMKNGYRIGLFNKRGFSSRSPYEGGTIEREKADYFKNLEEKFRFEYPNVARIFKDLKEGYLSDAKRMDEEAERVKLNC